MYAPFRSQPASAAFAAFLFAFLGGCPRDSRPAPEPGRELSDALARIERLQDEKREMSLKTRSIARELDAAIAALEAAKAGGGDTPEPAQNEQEILILKERIAELEARLAVSQAESQPGPDAIGRLFVTAVRKGDERAIDSLVDWERLLETAILKSASNGAADLAEFRALPASERAEKARNARDEFLEYVLGPGAPEIPAPAPIGETTLVPMRMRVGEPSAGVWYEVLLERMGGVWKVTGITREERPQSSGGDEGDGGG